MGSYRVCMCFTRKFMTAEVRLPADVREAFGRYAEGGARMTAEQLRRFLVEVQGESTASVAEAEKIVKEVLLRRRHRVGKFIRNSLTLDDFFYFLFSIDLNPPVNSQVHQDMAAPLADYFIYSCHNSYLTGNQLSSNCSDIPIQKALQQGVRVIELDLWPNSTKDNIHVLHGIRCLESIKEHAFSASPYPVILTLEDHLTPLLQEKAAQMITQTFGEMLWYPESECVKEFPSPEDLKYKVIVSTKPPKEYLEAEGSAAKGSSSEKEKDSDEGDDHKSSQQDDERKSRRFRCRQSTRHDRSDIRPIWFTQKNILRIFPKTTRFDSSNYNPLPGWRHGAQMVAFNMQGYGGPLWLMQGMFRANGGCGYVRKPDFLMHLSPDGQVFHPKLKLPVKMSLKVKVYMGDGWNLDFKRTHFDLYSPLDFYTKVGIAGVAADETMKNTRTKKDEWAPVWEEEFTFPLTVPELALLRVEVYEHDAAESDDFAGQTCLAVSELRQGIHAVPLYDFVGDKYDSVKLLMRFLFV